MKKSISSAVLSVMVSAVMMSAGVSASGGDYLDIPEGIDTSFKTYMDYRTITNKTSDQYKLQQQAYTDSDGIRRIDDDVCIAVGTGYAGKCGIRFEITLEGGESFTAVAADIKADRDTDSTHRYHPLRQGMGDMIEFIVDTDMLGKSVRRSGSIGTYEKYSGSVVSIRVLDE